MKNEDIFLPLNSYDKEILDYIFRVNKKTKEILENNPDIDSIDFPEEFDKLIDAGYKLYVYYCPYDSEIYNKNVIRWHKTIGEAYNIFIESCGDI